MKFFVPAAEDDAQAERVYKSIAEFVKAPINDERIWKLEWIHNSMSMQCEVGKPMPSYYETGDDPVLAIFDCGNFYIICTTNRGGVRGEPILAGKDYNSIPTYFN